ncbi:MAG: PD40 domain-containing protein, partial [Bacteroidales bacterium]|nr:PD40 domain-containing protein [Bacteroidales bacterium]
GILSFDPCADEISKSDEKQFLKAYSLFQNRKYKQSSLLLTTMVKEDKAFASVYFMLGMIGVKADNPKMIRKYFPLCYNECEDYSQPLLYYYLGIIDYSDGLYSKAQKEFEKFMSLSEDNEAYDSLRNEAINYLNWSDFLERTTNNPVEFNPKKIDYLAEKTNYYQPFITADSSEIYFIREELVMDTVKDSFLASASLRKEIKSCRAIMDSDFVYDRGLVLPLPFNQNEAEGRVSLTADKSMLFFSKRNKGSWDIYYCIRYGDYFSDAKPLNINTKEYDEMQPFISWDGNTLFFVSDRKGGKGGYDIWVSDRQDKETWGEARNLGPLINTPFDETFPFLSFDEQIIFFLSNGHQSIGGSDIFYKNLADGKKPQNIGWPINTELNENNIGLMPDGKTAYTVCQADKEKYQSVCTFTLPEQARSQECIMVKGKVVFEVESDISLDLFNLTKNNFHHINISPDNSEFALMLQKDCEYSLSFNKLGYMFSAYRLKFPFSDSLLVYVKVLESSSAMLLENIELNTSQTDFTQETYLSVIMPFLNFLSANAHLRINLYSEEKTLKVLEKHLLNKGIRKDRFNLKISQNKNIFYEVK